MTTRVLLVDDEPGIRKVVGITLMDMGFEVLEAENGLHALELFRAAKPQVVLTDIRMPVMDGLDLLRHIKEESPDTEVILVTGHGDMDMAVAGLKHGACDFISKPASPEILEVSLARATEKINIRAKMRNYTENLEVMVEQQASKLLELERQTIAGDAVQGITELMTGLACDEEVGSQLSSLLGGLPCLVSIQNRELVIVSVNELYRQRLGDRVGMRGYAVYAGLSGTAEGSPAARTFAEKRGLRTRETLMIQNAEVPAIVHTAPIRGVGGQVDLVLEIAVDVGEVKRLQEELRTSQQRYQQLFDEAPCYITVLDRSLNMLAANRRFSDAFGSGVGTLCHRAYRGTKTPCLGCPTLKTFDDGQTHQAEMTVTGKDGEAVSVLVWTAPIMDAAGKIESVMEMSLDITQMVRMQDHLASLGMLLASLSHGIKGLLTALDGGVYKVNSGLKRGDTEQVETGWAKVTELIGRIKSMVLDILFYAKKRELTLRTMDAATLAAQVADTVEPKAQKRAVDLVREIDPACGEFQVDEVVLSAALVNILENAVEAAAVAASLPTEAPRMAHSATAPDVTPDISQRILPRVPSPPAPRVVLRVRPDASGVFFEIEDNGVGIPPDVMGRLFTVFFSTKGSGGTGLGLFIAKKAVDQHGGRIGAVSEPGQGATFRLWIPRKQE
jgi:PAS domain S-box